MRTCVAALSLAFSLLVPIPGQAAETPVCGLQRVAELPVKTDNGELLVKMQIEGHDAWMMIDTGSPINLISPRLVKELNLRPLTITGALVADAAGATMKHFVHIKKLTLNGMVAEDQEFIVMGESAAGEIPFDGIFSAGFLAAYDVELDLAHGKLRLFTQDHCKGQVVYWTQDFVTVPFTIDASLHIVMPVTLDGQSLRAMLDTGATPSTLSSQTARRTFNIDPAGAGEKPDGQEMTGSGATLPYYKHRFADLAIGGVEFHNTEFKIMPDKMTRMIRDHQRYNETQAEQHIATQVTIGLHHLSRIRAYIAYGERMLYISAADAN